MIAAMRPGGKRVETLLQGQAAMPTWSDNVRTPDAASRARLLKRSEVVPEILDVLVAQRARHAGHAARDRKSTRLNSSHVRISYAVFCLKKKKKTANKTLLVRWVTVDRV